MSKAVKSDSLKEVLLAQENNAVSLVFCVILALVLPFFLIPIEKYILPWPWFIEELVKMAILWYLILPVRCWYCRLWLALAFILIFSVAENILYFPLFVSNQELGIYWERFTYPLAMHLVTFYLMLFVSWKHKKFIFFAGLLAMLLHYLYNTKIVYFLN